MIVALAFAPFATLADEGMWLPMLLEGKTITDMQARGCKLSAEDIYSINTTSMKDGICQFGGGCSAEMISDKVIASYQSPLRIRLHSDAQQR